MVVDCDPGIDDAIALAYLAGESVAGNARVQAVVAVRGNLDAATTARNAAFMLDRLGLGHVPVYRGADAGVTPLDEQLDATAFHGRDGLGGQFVAGAVEPPPSIDTAGIADLYVREASTGAELLAVGPLTNLALAARLRPSLPTTLPRTVVMGGAFGNPGGNIKAHAEYNFFLDAGAAQEVMGSGWPITLIPLDVTEQVLIRREDLDLLPDTERATLARRLLSASIDIHAEQMGIDGCIMHDALAAAVLLHPGLVTTTVGSVTVERDGAISGHSQLEPDTRQGSVAVGLEVDVDAARATILEGLSRL